MSHALHARARTTPVIRREIQNSTLSERKLAAKYNITRSTVRKWRQRDSTADRSHRAHTSYTPP
jgi:DNA-binding transcriptional regulator YiaG